MIEHIIIGAGGAGRTVAGACHHLDATLGFLDDGITAHTVNGIPVLGALAARVAYRNALYLVAFGSRYQLARRDVFAQLNAEGYHFFNVIAPQAYIDREAQIGRGVFIGAQCAILPNVTIGDNCNLCVACTLDHDTLLGNGVYLSPGVNLAGTVIVEEGAFIGTNATVIPGVRIGAWATVGAGAVVLHDVAPGDVVAGVPAKSTLHQGSE
ncbi:UDP-N-acetylbacillosamine N-acetyltransferase [Anaerolineae bacterium]|nr:UDP-N-acetylbacillosamine N-acetyltransferase [Anaerolineae bacterium]